MDQFKDALLKTSNNSQKTIKAAMLEVGAKTPEEVSDRKRVLNILRRRVKINRTKGHLAEKGAPFEKYGYDFYNEPTEVGIIKGVADIEQSLE
jgi:hypothetical protein